MTVGELQASLAQLDANLDVQVLLDESLAPVEGVMAIPGPAFLAIRGQAKSQPVRRFSPCEQGLIGHLSRLGLGNDDIGQFPRADRRERQEATKDAGDLKVESSVTEIRGLMSSGIQAKEIQP